jgi:hypothetical protein
MADSYEHDNGPPAFIKSGIFLDKQTSDYQLLKNVSAP